MPASRLENDHAFGPDVLLVMMADDEDAFREWKYGVDGELGEISDEHARLYAAIPRPSGPQLLAFETGADVVLDTCTVTYDEALDHLFGKDADGICARSFAIVSTTSERRTEWLALKPGA